MKTSRKLLSVLAVVTMTLSSLLATSPAAAEGTAPLVFSGEASLPKFPCPLPTAPEPPCAGVFDGAISGELAGAHFGSLWTATIVDATITADFSYADSCLRGTASGMVSVSAGLDNVFGTYDDGGPLPRPIVGLSIAASFDWARDGASALILPISAGTVVIDVAGLGSLEVMSGAVGAGAGTFVPMIDAEDAPDCIGLTNTPEITAKIAGTATLSDVM